MKPGADLRKAVDSDPVAKEIVELAQPLEGLTRPTRSTPPAVVIGAEPLMTFARSSRRAPTRRS